MEENISSAIQKVRKDDGTDVQCLLHVIQMLRTDEKNVPQLLTLSPNCVEVFEWWSKGSGENQHFHSGVCFSFFSLITRAVLNTSFQQQGIAVCRMVLKEHLHSVYSSLSKYSPVKTQRSCLEFLGLLNILSCSLTKILLEDFNFGNVSLKYMLLNKNAVHLDAVRFMLSFLCTSSTELKFKFMTMKHVLKTMTHKINTDNLAIKLELVTILNNHVLSDNKIAKSVKCKFFSVPVLAKISQFLSEPSAELRSQTTDFFKNLFSYKNGVMFHCKSSDVFGETSSNPILINFIKHVGVGSSLLNEIILNLIPEYPEISVSIINNLLNKSANDPETIINLCKVIESRDITYQLDIVTQDISDKHIIEYILPKCLTDLIDKQLKSSQLDPCLYKLILSVAQSAAQAVTKLKDRVCLRDAALFHLPDLSSLNSVGLLNPALVIAYLSIDQYCLILPKITISSLILPQDNMLSQDEVNMLCHLLPSELNKFVKSNADVITRTLSEGSLDDIYQRFFSKILHASGALTAFETECIVSVIFDNHENLCYGNDNKLQKMISNERNQIIGDLIEGILKSQNGDSRMNCSKILESSSAKELADFIQELLNPKFTKIANILVNTLEIVISLENRCPFYVLGYYFSLGIIRNKTDTLAFDCQSLLCFRNVCSALNISSVYVEKQGDVARYGLLNQVIMTLLNTGVRLDNNILDIISTTVSKFISHLLKTNYRFSSSEIISCILLKTDNLSNMILRSSVEENEKEISSLVNILQHRLFQQSLQNLQVFAATCNYLNCPSIVATLLAMIKPSQTDMNIDLAVKLISCLSDIKQLSEYLPRFTLTALFNELVKSEHIIHINLVISLAELLGNMESCPDFAITLDQYNSYLTENNSLPLSKILPYLKVTNKLEALVLVKDSLSHRITDLFLLPEYRKTLELSGCLKKKKLLKAMMEMFTREVESDSEIKYNSQDFTEFLSQFAVIYEDNLPVYTRKTIEEMYINVVGSLAAHQFNSRLEILTNLVLAFQTIISEKFVQSMFSTTLENPAIQSMLVASEHVSKFLCGLVSTNKVSSSVLTKQHYILFQSAYTATDSDKDTNILNILKYFERKHVSSKYPFAFGDHVEELKVVKNITLYNEHCIKIIETLDKQKLQNMIDNFPLHSTDSTKHSVVNNPCEMSYHPEFLLSLLHHVVHHGEVDVRTFLSHPLIQIPFLAVSSYDELTRSVGYTCLQKLLSMVQEESFKEKSMCSYILDMLQNSVQTDNQRLPHLSMYFLGKMLLAMFTPHKHMYTHICHFLLQRPIFDFQDVPMFYSLFCSASPNHKDEQVWLLKVLSVGVRDENDYHILSRRHVLPLLVSQFAAPNLETYTRKLVRQLLVKICNIKNSKVQKDLTELGIFLDIL